MGAAEQRQKDSAMASHLKASGIFHGRRQSAPFANSGGLTMVFAAGSAKYQRLMKKLGKAR